MKIKSIGILLVSFLLTLFANAQVGRKINEFKETGIFDIAIDRIGDFYLILNNQTVKKFDVDGKYTCSFESKDSINGFFPWNPQHVFLYNRTRQTILILDRALRIQQTIAVDPSLAVDPYLASPSSNNLTFWLNDKADQTIKKVDSETGAILSEINLKKAYASSVPDIGYFREYQNLIFVLDKNLGILSLSITGKRVNLISSNSISNFGFIGEDLYYLERNTLHFYNLYTQQKHELVMSNDTRYVVATDERLIVVSVSGTVTIFEFKPKL